MDEGRRYLRIPRMCVSNEYFRKVVSCRRERHYRAWKMCHVSGVIPILKRREANGNTVGRRKGDPRPFCSFGSRRSTNLEVRSTE